MSTDLRNKAIIIRDETVEGANTAERVGGWMVNASDEIEILFDHLQFIQNSEFLLALTDSEKRILWGIRRDLSPFEGKGRSSAEFDTLEESEHFINENMLTYEFAE